MADDHPQPKRLESLDAMRGLVMFLLLGGGEIGHAGFFERGVCRAGSPLGERPLPAIAVFPLGRTHPCEGPGPAAFYFCGGCGDAIFVRQTAGRG